MNPDRLAELEEERRFLLESIRDLDREREAGDVCATAIPATTDASSRWRFEMCITRMPRGESLRL